MSRVKGASGKEYEVLDVTKLQVEVKYEAFDAEKARLKAWGEGLKQGHKEGELRVKIDQLGLEMGKLKDEIDRKTKTVKMLLELIERYGLCREEMQLARMDLREAQDRWMEEQNVDGKNLGMFAHWVLEDMRNRGEI